MTAARLRLLYVLEGVALGAFSPFLVPLMAGRGISPAGIGLVLGVAALVTLAAYPTWGILADGPLGRERSLAACGLVAVLGIGGFALAGDDPLGVALAVAVFASGASPWGPITDALALGILGERADAYGRLRVWASVGWAASTLLCGVLLAGPGERVVLPIAIAAALGVAIVAATVRGTAHLAAAPATPDGVAPPGEPATGPSEIDLLPGAIPAEELATREQPGRLDIRSLRHRWRSLSVSPVLVPFLGCVFIIAMGTHAAYSFMSLRIADLGGGTILIGISAALPAIVESPIFAASRTLAARLGLRRLFVAGSLLDAVQFAVVAFVPQPALIAASRAIDGVAFGLRYTGLVLVVGTTLPARLRATGQSMAWLIAGGLAPVVAAPVGGVIYGSLGPSALFLGSALLVVVGSVLARHVLQGPAFGPTSGAPAAADSAAPSPPTRPDATRPGA